MPGLKRDANPGVLGKSCQTGCTDMKVESIFSINFLPPSTQRSKYKKNTMLTIIVYLFIDITLGYKSSHQRKHISTVE